MTTSKSELISIASTLEVFPNPSNGSINVVVPKNAIDITVTDIFGSTIYYFQEPNSILNLAIEKNGIYFICSKTNKELRVQKVVINK
jgi:hypothetical protein